MGNRYIGGRLHALPSGVDALFDFILVAGQEDDRSDLPRYWVAYLLANLSFCELLPLLSLVSIGSCLFCRKARHR